MTSAEVQSMLEGIEAAQQARALRMPSEQDAIRVMFDAWERLKELGWRDGRHMPTTGERFAGIQAGSTGIHAYTADKPEHFVTMYTIYDGDIWPTGVPPVLFRPWKETDVQVHLRICAPIPEQSHRQVARDSQAQGASTVSPAHDERGLVTMKDCALHQDCGRSLNSGKQQ